MVCGKVIKQLFLPFTNNQLTTSLCFTIFFPSALTLLLILLGIFLYVDVVASVVNLLYLSVSIWYIFDVLFAKTRSFFDFFKAWRYSPCLILIYGVLSSFRLYYIQFKELKILWGPGAEGGIWGPEFRGRITQRPIHKTSKPFSEQLFLNVVAVTFLMNF